MVKIGQASLGENGSINNGKSGNQNGKELNIRDYYLHSKGWRVFRAKDISKRSKISYAMKRAVANRNIGYDQLQRDTLWNQVKMKGYDIDQVKEPCETDCSALVRVCCAYAGIILQNFNTSLEPYVLKNSGEFIEVNGVDLSTGSGLLEGDILVTKTKGHTVVVTTASASTISNTYIVKGVIVKTLKKGDKGQYVRTLQRLLVSNKYSLGDIDGDFGQKTEAAVKRYQIDKGLVSDGIVGKNTWNRLLG